VNHVGEQTSVYVVSPQDKVEARVVTLGLQTPSEAEAESGLSEGESVIVSDRSGINPGQEVRPQVVQTMQIQGTSQP